MANPIAGGYYRTGDTVELESDGRLSGHAYPRSQFTEQLPKTASGKLQRFLPRNQEKAKGPGGAV